jgi:RNA polymerase sigma factor (TIGR02999 family)
MNNFGNHEAPTPRFALADLDAVLYKRLCNLASGFLKRERREFCWEAADLVHEAFLRMLRSRTKFHFNDANQVFALSAVVMRHILIDWARSAKISQRSGVVSLDLVLHLSSGAGPGPEKIALQDALNRLESRLRQVVRMRVFYGMQMEEIAAKLSISSRTVGRAWKMSRECLRQELDVHLSTRRSRCHW